MLEKHSTLNNNITVSTTNSNISTNKNKNKNNSKNDIPANNGRWSAIACRRNSYSNNKRSANSTFNDSPPNAVKNSPSRTLRKALREDFNLKSTKRVNPNFSPKSKIIETSRNRWSATGRKLNRNSKRDLALRPIQHSLTPPSLCP